MQPWSSFLSSTFEIELVWSLLVIKEFNWSYKAVINLLN